MLDMDINLAKKEAAINIDRAAGEARCKFITTVPGQGETYILKAKQAELFKAANYTGTVPGLIQAEVDATGTTAQQATDFILMMQELWLGKATQIESARRRGKVLVDSSSTVEEVYNHQSVAINELEGL